MDRIVSQSKRGPKVVRRLDTAIRAEDWAWNYLYSVVYVDAPVWALMDEGALNSVWKVWGQVGVQILDQVLDVS